MNENEFCDIYIKNSFKLTLVLLIFYRVHHYNFIYFSYCKSAIQLYSCKFFTTINYLSLSIYLSRISGKTNQVNRTNVPLMP